MEQALRNECNYTGAIPYWDWTKTAKEGFNASSAFDGSATSLSGNGAPVNRSETDRVILNINTTAQVGKCKATRPRSPPPPPSLKRDEAKVRDQTRRKRN